MTSPVGGAAPQRLWQALCSGDTAAARTVVHELLDGGTSGTAVVTDLLAPAMQEVGARWQRREWGVADEHAATAVVDAALAAVEARAPAPPSGGPLVAMACAEGEWHGLPARMAAQLLRENGATVRFLGPSMPADHLREHLARLAPDALVLSATVPTALPGAARSIEAAHDAGVPVLAGGRAFGTDGSLAASLGADGWSAGASGLSPDRLPTARTGRPAELDWATCLGLQVAAPAVVSAAVHGLLVRVPALQHMTGPQWARTREDLQHVLDFLAAAALVREPAVFDAFTSWLLDVLDVRGVHASDVLTAYSVLADEVDAGPAALLRASAAAHSGPRASAPPSQQVPVTGGDAAASRPRHS